MQVYELVSPRLNDIWPEAKLYKSKCSSNKCFVDLQFNRLSTTINDTWKLPSPQKMPQRIIQTVVR